MASCIMYEFELIIVKYICLNFAHIKFYYLGDFERTVMSWSLILFLKSQICFYYFFFSYIINNYKAFSNETFTKMKIF